MRYGLKLCVFRPGFIDFSEKLALRLHEILSALRISNALTGSTQNENPFPHLVSVSKVD